MTISTTLASGQAARRADASPGATADEVSAGVRSRGRGITARTGSPAAQPERQPTGFVADERHGPLGELAGQRPVGDAPDDVEIRRCSSAASIHRGAPKPEDTPRRGVERARIEQATRVGAEQGRFDPSPGARIRRRQEQVHARADGRDDVDRLVRTLGEGAHVERVGDRDAAEAEVADGAPGP